MATRSRRLVDPVFVPAAAATVYTAPEFQRVIVKGVRLVNVTGESVTVRLCIAAEAPENAVYWELPLVPGEHFTDDSWWMLDPEDELVASASDADAVTMLISGAELGA